MAYRLKSRVRGIPHGLKFNQPEIGWESVKVVGRAPSWEQLVTALIAARAANPAQAQKHGWSLDPAEVADEVDAYNSRLCLEHGWQHFLVDGAMPSRPVPKVSAPSPSEKKELAAVAGRVEKIWTGIKTLNEWIDSGEPAVESGLSAQRAAVCAKCPKNGPGDFTSWFTRPAAAAIKRQMERLEQRQLSTPDDARLNVCEVCLCPLRLKVHTPMKYVLPHLSAAVQADLRAVPGCWIMAEMAS